MGLNFVSSMNLKLYDSYGRRFIREFLEMKSNEIKLYIAFEDGIPEDILKFPELNVLQLQDSNQVNFLKSFSHLIEAHGRQRVVTMDVLGKKQTQLSYNYRYDAIRFSFKIFSLLLAKKYMNSSDSFVWIDADVRCLRSFSESDLKQFMPHNKQIMSYLGRTSFPAPNPYCEGGFIGFNGKNPNTDLYLNRVQQVYLTGEIFNKKEWHDCYQWDGVRVEFKNNGHIFKNISGAAEILDHPFVNCGLEKFFDHLKGPERKRLGRSFNEDYKMKKGTS